MPTVVSLQFPARRYHATPWGAGVNEGQIEWPPAPWRILRAFIATGFERSGWPADGPPAAAKTAILRLASALPEYRLPVAAIAHSRHYMPVGGKPTLVIDAWADIEAGPIEVRWPVDLAADEREAFQDLVERLPYLGRAESWVEAKLLNDLSGAPNAFPLEGGAPAAGWEPVHLMAPVPETEYETWYSERTTTIRSRYPAEKLKAKERKALNAELANLPSTYWDVLCTTTGTLQTQRWSAPPGTREAAYWRAPDLLRAPPPIKVRIPETTPVPFALLALATSSRGTSALPASERVWPQAALAHRALATQVGRAGGEPDVAAVLLGRATPDALHERGHGHAHLLHLDLDGDGRLDHLLIYAPRGLTGNAQRVIAQLRRTWMKGGAGELQIALAATGHHRELTQLEHPYGTTLEKVLGPEVGATDWISVTPFFFPRYVKEKGRNTREGQLAEELISRDLPPASIEWLPLDASSDFKRFRHFPAGGNGKRPPSTTPHALRLRFERPVQGPLTLGWGAHRGLGLFRST